MVDRDGVVETFLAYLRDHNLPVTQQRIDIAKVLLGSDRHLSVEDLAGELQQRGQKGGLATVYRTIELLRHRPVIHGACASCRSGGLVN